MDARYSREMPADFAHSLRGRRCLHDSRLLRLISSPLAIYLCLKYQTAWTSRIAEMEYMSKKDTLTMGFIISADIYHYHAI